jgi:5-methylcytosine-specific restriction endonuclease McrA
MSNFAFLIDANKIPMNPIHPSHARKLLDSGKATVFRQYPFTLIMNRVVENIVAYPITLKIDPGSKFTGISLVNNKDEVIWGMELEHRGSLIKKELDTRRAVRRGRRNRTTRYRPARFLNRTKPKDWLAPSLQHRVLTTETWIKRLIKFAPITNVKMELVKFDLQKTENPEISGIEYQQGELLGYEVREYILEKWERKCTYCSQENVPLQIEHIVPKAKGGTNRISNLCLACEKCNQKKGTRDLKDFLNHNSELSSKILKQAKAPLKDAAAVNSTRWKLFNSLKEVGLPVTTGSGGLTKFNRTRLGLPKEHWIDAACVGVTESLKILTEKILKVKSIGQGTRRLCRMNKFGFPCSKPRKKYNIPWRTGDITRTESGIIGRVVVQNEKLLEIRVDGNRHRCKPTEIKPVHRKDGYSYV